MQSVQWYIKRLSTMSPSEIAWRIQSIVRDRLDKYRFGMGWYPSATESARGVAIDGGSGFNACDIAPEAETWTVRKDLEDSRNSLFVRADKIAAHRLSFFDLEDKFIGNPIDWNRDHAHSKKAPLGYAQEIDYRDFRVTGDCKLVWEPNRHHHLVVLGRAYRAGGNVRYASEAVGQLQSWMDQCPFGMGMNWRSSLELGIRLINWVWTIDLIKPSGLVVGEFRKRLLHNVYLHLWEVVRKFSRGSSANNHLVGEAAGVYIASNYFKGLRDSVKWGEQSRRILIREIIEQTFPDGCTREQAMGYHLFVLQFFIVAGLVGRWTGQEFPAAYWQRLEKMLEFAGAMIAGGECLPMFGDGDDGYVMDLGSGPCSAQDLLCIGAVLFNRPDFKFLAGGFKEPALWLQGPSSRDAFDAIPAAGGTLALTSKAFEDSGCYLLQCGTEGSSDRVSVFMDCGELGFKSIAAHGHADALSIMLRAFGQDVFVDPGTYDYFTYPEWRNYFRSTRAHNTVLIDNVDQSVMHGPFMWGERARSRCILWEPSVSGGGRITAEHDGYRRLADPVTHRRAVELNAELQEITILDEIIASGSHAVSVIFQLSEQCIASPTASNRIEIALKGGIITLEVDPRLAVNLLCGSENPLGGWVSRGYHRKVPATMIIAEGMSRGTDSFRSRVQIGFRS